MLDYDTLLFTLHKRIHSLSISHSLILVRAPGSVYGYMDFLVQYSPHYFVILFSMDNNIAACGRRPSLFSIILVCSLDGICRYA